MTIPTSLAPLPPPTTPPPATSARVLTLLRSTKRLTGLSAPLSFPSDLPHLLTSPELYTPLPIHLQLQLHEMPHHTSQNKLFLGSPYPSNFSSGFLYARTCPPFFLQNLFTVHGNHVFSVVCEDPVFQISPLQDSLLFLPFLFIPPFLSPSVLSTPRTCMVVIISVKSEVFLS